MSIEMKPTQGIDPEAKAYLDLVWEHPLRPIRTDAEVEDACAMMNRLADRDTLSPGQRDYMIVLATLIEAFEDEHEPRREPISGADALRLLLEEHGMSPAQLADEFGVAEEQVANYLSGTGLLDPALGVQLARRFKMDPTLFVGPPA